MKKLLSILLSAVMAIAIMPLSPAGTFAEENTFNDLLPDYGENMQTGENGSVYSYRFVAEKDGVYSVTEKATDGTVNLHSTSLEFYTDDYRPSDDAHIYYYNMKKGQELKIEFTCSANTIATVVRRSVDTVSDGDEFNFTGEYDRSFIIPNSYEYYGNVKFAAETPRDSAGNPIFEARYRLLKALSTDGDNGSVYLDRKDVRVNSAINISPSGEWSDYFILNVYANGSSTTIGDPTTTRSKVKFVKMENYNTDGVTFNLVKNPEPIYESSNCFKETDASGNTYNKYYYRSRDYLKSVTIDFGSGNTTEIPSDLLPYDEPNPYSKYTGLYVSYTDNQADSHWSVGTNYFTAKIGEYNTEQIPVVIKSASDLESFSLYEEKSVPYRANTRYFGYYSFTPNEDGEYTITIEDMDWESYDEVGVIVGSQQYDISRSYYLTGDTSREYVTENIKLTGGKAYPITFVFMRNGSGDGTIKLSVKKRVPVSSVKANVKADAPKLVYGVNKTNGKYNYDISEYADSVDVTYTDGKPAPLLMIRVKKSTFLPQTKSIRHTVYLLQTIRQ